MSGFLVGVATAVVSAILLQSVGVLKFSANPSKLDDQINKGNRFLTDDQERKNKERQLELLEHNRQKTMDNSINTFRTIEKLRKDLGFI